MGPMDNTVIETKSGKLQGVREDGLFVFKGIPYAAPPVGELRWMPPQPVKGWSGIRPATEFGPIAPQDANAMAIPGRLPSEEPQSEDCLFLNVWTPGIDNAKRAVMVWIHGGGFTRGSGSSPMNPGRTLPNRGGVALVTINYRLGALGFLHLRELTGGRVPATGNEALLDQIAALQWIRDNIANFGGDPDNVTVFGESAGAESIGALLAMPQASGLFQKAIIQSGASTYRALDQALKMSERFLSVLGLKGNDVDGLLALTPEQLLAAHRKWTATGTPGARGGNLGPVLDGQVLKEVPLDAVEQGSARDVSLLAGSNLEEGKLFAMLGPSFRNLDEAGLKTRLKLLVPDDLASALIEKYRRALSKRETPVTPYEIYVAIQGDQHFRMPVIRLCEFQERLGKPAYGYVFTWKSTAPGFGACHALDVGFVFGNLSDEFHGCGLGAENLAANMQEAWTAFARTGNPSCPGLGEWPNYGSQRRMMVLDARCHVETAPYEEERKAWDGIPNTLLG